MASKGISALIATGGIAAGFTLLGGWDTLRTADEIRNIHPSNAELVGHLITNQPHILHDLVSDPLEDGSYDQTDGLLALTEAKLLASAVALSVVVTAVGVVRKGRA